MSIVTKESNPELYNALFPDDEIKEILDNLEYVADIHKVHIKDGYKVAEEIPSSLAKELRLNSHSAKLLLDYITNLQQAIEQILQVLNNKRDIVADRLICGLSVNHKELCFQIDEEIRNIIKEVNKNVERN